MTYRNYEVYQRERVGETTNLVSPRDLIADGYLDDPFTLPGVLRENYPCYRDWVGNRFWLTRYDDVTSVFVDDANFESRTRKATYGPAISGTDLGMEPEVREATSARAEEFGASLAQHRVLAEGADELVMGFVLPLQLRMTATVLGLDVQDALAIFPYVEELRRGAGWLESDRVRGISAFRHLADHFDALLAERRRAPTEDLIGAIAGLGGTGADLAITLLELQDETLPASLANLWCLLLQHPEQLDRIRDEPRLMKLAYHEALRHSPPVSTTDRFARHEVERFGRLIPHGALLHLSAAAANRDPRQFAEPDSFDVDRKDLCQREPRGQYRADGLPSGIAFGYGPPSREPASPKEGPRSRFAIAGDVAVHASLALLEQLPQVRLADGATPFMSLDRFGGIYSCRSLPLAPVG